jgi:tRNA dimethylallyltransferase
MLYFKALLQGLDDLPPADAALRQTLERRRGWPGLHAERCRLTWPLRHGAERCAADGRALEIFRLTGCLSPARQGAIACRIACCNWP